VAWGTPLSYNFGIDERWKEGKRETQGGRETRPQPNGQRQIEVGEAM
jgi:hypothetical protein